MDGDSIAKNSVDGDTAAGPQVFTVPQAAARLRLGKSTVWALVANGTIASFKVGRSRRIRAESLNEFIGRQAAAGQSEPAA